jgi:hypothetical protein
MAASPCPIPSHQYPLDLILAITQNAARDADLVAIFLDALGLRTTGEGHARVPVRLPAFFLLGLASAVRLLAWEKNGLQVHRAAGLPSADEVFRWFRDPRPLAEKEQAAAQLGCRELAVFIERLAWNGGPLLGADVELREADEDTLVGALANFLWAHRHDGGGAAPTEGGRP